jgi:hypothetical protein
MESAAERPAEAAEGLPDAMLRGNRVHPLVLSSAWRVSKDEARAS